ncbi:hypothetical protein D3C78_1639340 [compost metagenome]
MRLIFIDSDLSFIKEIVKFSLREGNRFSVFVLEDEFVVYAFPHEAHSTIFMDYHKGRFKRKGFHGDDLRSGKLESRRQ